MNLHIGEIFIKNNSGKISYEKGVEYYKNNNVNNIKMMHKKNYKINEEYIRITGEVDDGYDIKKCIINLYFKPIHNEFLCDCKSEGIKHILCEHCVAVLMKCVKEQKKMVIMSDDNKYDQVELKSKLIEEKKLIQKKELAEQKILEQEKEAALSEQRNVKINEYIERIKNGIGDKKVVGRRKIKIKLVYYFEKVGENTYISFIKLKTGSIGFKLLKDIESFLIAVDKNLKNEYYNPSICYIDKEDRKLINFLTDIYEYKINEDNLSIINISDREIKRLFEIIGDNSFEMHARGFLFPNAKFLIQDIPMEFKVFLENEDKIIIENRIQKMPIPLTTDNKYLYYDGNVYNPSDKQIYLYNVFFDSLFNSDKKRVEFKKEELEQVYTYIIPTLKKFSRRVKIDKSIDDMFVEYDLNIKTYIDKESDEIIIDIKYNYGDIEIIAAEEEKFIKTEGSMLVRDLTRELEIIEFLKGFGFEKIKNKYVLSEEGDILNFIVDGVDSLKEFGEVYLSQSFKQIKIYNSNYYSGKIGASSTNWLDFNFSIEGIEQEEIQRILDSMILSKKYYRLKDGNFINLEDEKLESIREIIHRFKLDTRDVAKGVAKIPKFNVFYLEEKFNDFDLNFIERDISFKEIIQKFKNVKQFKNIKFDVPKELENVMRDYQKEGFTWFKNLEHYGFGGILADEMGLGKTIQTIAFIKSRVEEFKANGQKLTSLVVVPTSIIYNWKDEIEKFAPDLKTLILEGNSSHRMALIRDLEDYDIVITSYGTLRNDIDLYKHISFDVVIIDEAQNVKNRKALASRSIRELKGNVYYALTGTPMENSLSELWSVFDFIMPGYLGVYSEFVDKYENPILKAKDEEAYKDLLRHIKPFILRRFKKDVIKELPDKIEKNIVLEMTEEQKKLYYAYLQKSKSEYEDELMERGIQGSRIKILSILMRLRQICCDPRVFMENFVDESAKMLFIKENLKDMIAEGHRILIFSQFTSVLKNIEMIIEELDMDYMYLDGSTKADKRLKMVKEFNNGVGDVFLISLKAGGTGLNLTGADVVIHFDPWWNPAVEQQATDRAHRIGQEKVVEVIKLLTKGTIEEKIYELQEKKKELIRNVIDAEGDTDADSMVISKMSKEEIEDLFYS